MNDNSTTSTGQGVSGKSKSKSNGPTIRWYVDGEQRTLPIVDLLDDQKFKEVAQEIDQSNNLVKFVLDSVPMLPQDARLALIDLLACVQKKCTYQAATKKHKDVLGAMLALIPDESNMEFFGAAKKAALETAAVFYGDDPELACKRIGERLRELGIKPVRDDGIVKAVRSIWTKLSGCASSKLPGMVVSNLFKDAPVPASVVFPSGYDVGATEVRSQRAKDEGIVIPAPILITKRVIDPDCQREMVELAWYRDGQWQKRIVDRATVANASEIVDLADHGVPVTSVNAKMVVQYLADFEAINLDQLAQAKVSQRLGWLGKSQAAGFLLGTQHIVANEDAVEFTFRGQDVGDVQIASAFCAKGSFAKWKSAIHQIIAYPKVLLTFYVGFVAPLLALFRTPNFCFDLSGRTTTGKTTTLRIVASIWGNPDEQQSASVLKTWAGTATWLERVSAVLNNLPFVVDDTKQAREDKVVEKTVYSVAQGVGRGRGSTTGLAAQNTWRTILITSGEQPLTSFSQDGGTRARVLTSWGQPFGKTDSHTGELAAQLNDAVKQNFGHAGRAFIRFLIENPTKVAKWREQYASEHTKFREMASKQKNPYAGRMAPYFAVITMAARIAHEALDLPWSFSDPIGELWGTFAIEAGEANRGTAALRYVIDWFAANQDAFFTPGHNAHRQPHSGWAGRCDRDNSKTGNNSEWTVVGFMVFRLEQLLKEAGFEPESIIRTWMQDGWLITTKDSNGNQRRDKKMRVGKQSVRVICFKREQVDAVLS